MTTEVSERKNFWLKIAESNLATILDNMGYDQEWLIRFQKKRLLRAIIAFALGTVVGALISTWIMLIGPVLAVFVWSLEYRRILAAYKKYQYQNELQFNKFSRMLIPFLRRQMPIYTAP